MPIDSPQEREIDHPVRLQDTTFVAGLHDLIDERGCGYRRKRRGNSIRDAAVTIATAAEYQTTM